MKASLALLLCCALLALLVVPADAVYCSCSCCKNPDSCTQFSAGCSMCTSSNVGTATSPGVACNSPETDCLGACMDAFPASCDYKAGTGRASSYCTIDKPSDSGYTFPTYFYFTGSVYAATDSTCSGTAASAVTQSTFLGTCTNTGVKVSSNLTATAYYDVSCSDSGKVSTVVYDQSGCFSSDAIGSSLTQSGECVAVTKTGTTTPFAYVRMTCAAAALHPMGVVLLAIVALFMQKITSA